MPAVTHALAMLLVESLHVPVDMPADLSEHFREVQWGNLEKTLTLLNEHIRLDVEAIEDQACKLYCWRVAVASGKINGGALYEGTAVVDYFGISRFFSPDELKCIEDCRVDIIRHCISLKLLLTDLGLST